jgi:hypothetical protein
MAKELLDIAILIYILRFRVVWRLGCVTNTFARAFARFARTLPTPLTTRLIHTEQTLPFLFFFFYFFLSFFFSSDSSVDSWGKCAQFGAGCKLSTFTLVAL